MCSLRILPILTGGLLLSVMLSTTSCNDVVEHTAPAVNPKDSSSLMVSYGVNTLISDSGVMRYRIVSEVWEVNQVRNPSRWIFEKGIFLEQFDEKFHIEAYIQSDTAYYYDQQKLWELRGRVRVRTKDGLRFSSEELFWDQLRHEFYSNRFSHVITPEREMQSFVRGKDGMGTNEGDTILSAPDSVKSMKRHPNTPKAKSQ